MRGPSETRWWWLVIALGALAALRYVAVFFRHDAYGIAKHFMADDAFYYFQVARHVAAGHGSTFDGVHVTNGYHPMWLLLTAGIFRISGGTGDVPLYLIYGLQVAMLVASAVLLYRSLSEFDCFAAACTTALFLASNATRNTLFIGMESTLAFFVMCLLLRIATKRGVLFMVPDTGRIAVVMFGLLLILCLTRLETGLFAALWLGGALVLDSVNRSGHRGRILLIAFGLAIAAAAYAAVNLALVGLPMPISGFVKAGGATGWQWFADVFANHRVAFAGLVGPPVRGPGLDPISIVASMVLIVALVGFLARPRREAATRALVFGPFLLFVLGYVASAVFVTHGHAPAYQWPALLMGTLATFALLAAPIVPLGSRLFRGALALGILCFVGFGWVSVLKNRTLADWGPMRGYVMDETIRFLSKEIPAGDRVGAYSSGIMTYFSGRETENLEGLVNGIDFFRARRSPATFADYLRRNRIRWIVFRTSYPGEKDAHVREWGDLIPIVRTIDLDAYYHLDMRARHPAIAEPNVYILELGI